MATRNPRTVTPRWTVPRTGSGHTTGPRTCAPCPRGQCTGTMSAYIRTSPWKTTREPPLRVRPYELREVPNRQCYRTSVPEACEHECRTAQEASAQRHRTPTVRTLRDDRSLTPTPYSGDADRPPHMTLHRTGNVPLYRTSVATWTLPRGKPVTTVTSKTLHRTAP